MKVLAFLFINFVFVESISFSNTTNVKPFSSHFDVINEIVGNYLNKYISRKTSILSIAIASSSVQQNHFHEDLITKFVTSPKISNFSYNILIKVDQTRQENNQAFNLIFIDDSNALV